MSDAVHDGLLAKSPCSRRTSPQLGQQRVYVATTEQVWELYDLFPDRIRLVILLGAFVGLRLAETCGLRPQDIDFLRGIVHPHVQYPAEPLKSNISRTAVPVPASLVAELSAQIAGYGRYPTLLTGEDGRQLSPWAIERAIRTARKKVQGLPAGFRYNDLRHYFASLLIASGADMKRSRPGCAMPAPRPRSTPTGTSGPTGTSRPAPLWMPSSLPGRNSDGTTVRLRRNGAGQHPSSCQQSKYSSNSCGCGRSRSSFSSATRL